MSWGAHTVTARVLAVATQSPSAALSTTAAAGVQSPAICATSRGWYPALTGTTTSPARSAPTWETTSSMLDAALITMRSPGTSPAVA